MPRAPAPPVGCGSAPPAPASRGLRWLQFPGTSAGGRSPSPPPLLPQSTVHPRVPGAVSGPRPPPRSSPWVPGTAGPPAPGVRALVSALGPPGGDGDPRVPGAGGWMPMGFTLRGWGLTRGPCLEDGVQGDGPCRDPACHGRQRWRCGDGRTDGRCPGRGVLPAAVLRRGRPCYARAALSLPSLVLMASSGVVVILLTTAKLAQRKGQPQIALSSPKNLLLKFGGEVWCQGKAVKCRNNYTWNSYEGSASIFK